MIRVKKIKFIFDDDYVYYNINNINYNKNIKKYKAFKNGTIVNDVILEQALTKILKKHKLMNPIIKKQIIIYSFKKLNSIEKKLLINIFNNIISAHIVFKQIKLTDDKSLLIKTNKKYLELKYKNVTSNNYKKIVYNNLFSQKLINQILLNYVKNTAKYSITELNKILLFGDNKNIKTLAKKIEQITNKKTLYYLNFYDLNTFE